MTFPELFAAFPSGPFDRVVSAREPSRAPALGRHLEDPLDGADPSEHHF